GVARHHSSTVLYRPLPSSPARPPRNLIFLSPPHARHVDHPALAGAGCPGRDRTVVVGRGARGAVVVELPRRGGQRPAGAGADDVGGLARVNSRLGPVSELTPQSAASAAGPSRGLSRGHNE